MILSILVVELAGLGWEFTFLINIEVGHFMAHVINFERDRLPAQFKGGFQLSLRLENITDTHNKVKLHIVMDLLAKKIITPPK